MKLLTNPPLTIWRLIQELTMDTIGKIIKASQSQLTNTNEISSQSLTPSTYPDLTGRSELCIKNFSQISFDIIANKELLTKKDLAKFLDKLQTAYGNKDLTFNPQGEPTAECRNAIDIFEQCFLFGISKDDFYIY